MTALEHSVRTQHIRCLRLAIERAVKQTCISLDLAPSAETDHLISEAARDVAQLHASKADADIDVDLNRQEKTT